MNQDQVNRQGSVSKPMSAPEQQSVPSVVETDVSVPYSRPELKCLGVLASVADSVSKGAIWGPDPIP